MEILVSFNGGPLDGDAMASDTSDPTERRKAQRVGQIIGGYLRDAEERDVTFAPKLTYTVPSEWIIDKAKRENWSEADMAAASARRHEYEYAGHQEVDGVAEISMKFVRSFVTDASNEGS